MMRMPCVDCVSGLLNVGGLYFVRVPSLLVAFGCGKVMLKPSFLPASFHGMSTITSSPTSSLRCSSSFSILQERGQRPRCVRSASCSREGEQIRSVEPSRAANLTTSPGFCAEVDGGIVGRQREMDVGLMLMRLLYVVAETTYC
jgi:hypothetical protein